MTPSALMDRMRRRVKLKRVLALVKAFPNTVAVGDGDRGLGPAEDSAAYEA
jgi:hypothetical protein